MHVAMDFIMKDGGGRPLINAPMAGSSVFPFDLNIAPEKLFISLMLSSQHCDK